MNKESSFYTIMFTFIVTFVFVTVLALANELTKERAQTNKELFVQKAILSSMQISYENADDAVNKFTNYVTKQRIQDNAIFTSDVNNKKIYSIICSGSGLWGTITCVMAVDEKVSKIIGIDFIEQNETPGLGGRIEEQWFKDQFKNEVIQDNKVTLNVSGGKGDLDKNNGIVDSVTGATITSKRVEEIINKYIKIMQKILLKN